MYVYTNSYGMHCNSDIPGNPWGVRLVRLYISLYKIHSSCAVAFYSDFAGSQKATIKQVLIPKTEATDPDKKEEAKSSPR